MRLGTIDNDFLLTRDEPGHREDDLPDDEGTGLVRGPTLTELLHDIRRVRNVRASFAVDTTTGAVTRCP